MQNPNLARYKILQGLLLQAFEAKDPVNAALEAGVSEADLPLLAQLSRDPELKVATGTQKWLPNLAREISEALSEDRADDDHDA